MTGRHGSPTIDYATFVPAMARYFTRMEALHSAAWSDGRAAATLWERLLANRTDAELAELDDLMRTAARDPGSARQEMILFFPAWRHSVSDCAVASPRNRSDGHGRES